MLLVRKSVSKETWSFYSRVWQEWEVFLSSVGGSCDDFEMGLLYFIGRSFESGVTHSGMSRRLSALAFWFQLRSVRDHTKSMLVRRALRGFRRGQVVRDRRRPVSYELLLALGDGLDKICFSAFEVLLFRAAYALAFFGAFRISELVSHSRKTAGGLQVEDVSFLGEVLACEIRRSKTDQQGKGVRVLLHRLDGSSMCPVRVLREYLAVRPDGPGPLLVHAGGLFLSVFQFVQVFRRSLSKMGFEPKEYSSHSFRIGAATEAARWGLSPEAVKRIGRWESERYKIYVRPHLL